MLKLKKFKEIYKKKEKKKSRTLTSEDNRETPKERYTFPEER